MRDKSRIKPFFSRGIRYMGEVSGPSLWSVSDGCYAKLQQTLEY